MRTRRWCICLIAILLVPFGSAIDACGLTVVSRISLSPVRLVNGDGRSKQVTLAADLTDGDTIHIRVDYRAALNSSTVAFISSYAVRDGGSEDRDQRAGKIRVVLRRSFEQIGIYHVKIEEAGTTSTIVHEPAPSYWSRFVDLLLGASGDGTRSENIPSVTTRLDDRPGSTSIWTAPVPAADREIEDGDLKLGIRQAMMPSWSSSGDAIICSAWRQGKWVIAAYTIAPSGEMMERWQWSSANSTGDFSPAWSPDGRAIAFVRRTPARNTDVWILRLDAQRRPVSEVPVTTLNNVQQVIAWDASLGILFETVRNAGDQQQPIREVWSLEVRPDQLNRDNRRAPTFDTARAVPRPSPYRQVRGRVASRNSLILDEQDVVPRTTVTEMTEDGRVRTILIGADCSYKWISISRDGNRLALDSDCPPDR